MRKRQSVNDKENEPHCAYACGTKEADKETAAYMQRIQKV